ncbi:MAG: ACP S-malonyltransferase [Deltaproteobacteria bacterium]|nr:ACP S-malonyltransferase [Deltaproteobacteria bacterium]
MAKWALLFPGQGSQYVSMGKDLKDNFKEAADVFAEADDALSEKLSKLCFDGPESDLKLTMNTQPAILTVSVAVLRVLQKETDIVPSLLAGHSLGEYSALVCSGALEFTDAVRIVRKRGTYMQEAVPVGVGGMAAILGMEVDAVEKICNECAEDQLVSPANYNCPGQIVISGHTEAVQRAAEKAEAEGAKRAVILQVSAPFHSALMKPAAEKLGEALEPIQVGDLGVPVLSNADADFYPSKEDVKRLLTKQVDHPVRWTEEMDKLLGEGVDNCLELGPGNVLRGLMRKINREIKTKNIGKTEEIKDFVASL